MLNQPFVDKLTMVLRSKFSEIFLKFFDEFHVVHLSITSSVVLSSSASIRQHFVTFSLTVWSLLNL